MRHVRRWCLLAATLWTHGCGGGDPGRPAGIPDPHATGPYAVGFTSLVALDTSRDAESEFGGRPISVFVWYPADPGDVRDAPEALYPLDPAFGALGGILGVDAIGSSDLEARGLDAAFQEPPASADGPFPLVVFSPGYTGPNFGYVGLGARLASHGFMVAALTHTGDGPCICLPGEAYYEAAGVFWQDPIEKVVSDRAPDVSFVLDGLLERNGVEGDLLYGAIDPEQIAASGHSLGGHADYALAGRGEGSDPRIRAVAMLDGSNQFLTFEQLHDVEVPTLWVGRSCTELGYYYAGYESWVARGHAALAAETNLRVGIGRTEHVAHFSSFCEVVDVLFGLPESCENPRYRPPLEGEELAEAFLVAFLKTHLAGESGYEDVLEASDEYRADGIEILADEPGDYATAAESGEFNFWCDGAGEPTVYEATIETQETCGAEVVGESMDPADAGCSDGTREGFVDLGDYPEIATCFASFPPMSLRTPRTGAACGDDAGECTVPGDACADGWHICVSNGHPEDLTSRLVHPETDCTDCAIAGGGRNAVAANDTVHYDPDASVCDIENDGQPIGCGAATPGCCGGGCGGIDEYCVGLPWGYQWYVDGCDSWTNGTGVVCCRDPAIGGA